MNIFDYPSKADLKNFVKIITDEKFAITKYLPRTNERWFELVSAEISYVASIAHYGNSDFHSVAAQLLYKVAKRHELGDGNKRSAVISVYLFAILNDYFVVKPTELKRLARRIAKTKGRKNEELIKHRIATVLRKSIQKE